MAADFKYFDTSYLVRLYLRDKGFEEVRDLAGSSQAIASAWHAQAEVFAALHRAYREGRLPQEGFQTAMKQFIRDSQDGLFVWIPLKDNLLKPLETFFLKAGTKTFIRSADAMHLACAREQNYKVVYSNDRHFLAAAPLFGLRGMDIISN